MTLLHKIINFWHSFSYYHHYVSTFSDVLAICVFAGFIHFLLNKLVNNFPKFYSKYNKSQEPPVLLKDFIQISKKPLVVLIWFLCSILILELFVHRKSIDSFKILTVIIILTWLSLRLLHHTEEYLINFVYKGEHTNFRQNKTTIIAVWRLLKMLLVIFAFLMAMQALHVDITGIVAIGSASTIVLGIAAKELLANFFGGMMIFMDRQFMVGDSIKSPNQDIEGVIEYIGWRLTRIRTVDKSLLYVPNSVFLTISVENTSRRYNRQIKEVIRLKYKDLQKVNDIIDDLSNMLKIHPEIDANQMCFVGLNQFNYMSADCLLWCFTKATDQEGYLKVLHDILYKVGIIVGKHGVEIAFSHLGNNIEDLNFSK